MKILVSGSSGFLGNALCETLSIDHQVYGLDRVEGKYTSLVHELVKPIDLPDVDLIFHTAALHAPHVGKYSDAEFIDTNIQGTLRLLEHAVTCQVQRVVFTSSTSIYGNVLAQEGVTWIDESLVPQPRDIYDITKFAAEQLCYDFNRRYGLAVSCLRVGRFWNEPLQDRFFYRMFRGLDIRDAVGAHLMCMNHAIPEIGTYNIAAQSPFDKSDLPELERDPWMVIDRKVPSLREKFIQELWSLPSIVDRVYDITNAKKELGYRPKYNILEMLRLE